METRTIERALQLTGRTMDAVNKYRPVIGAGYGDYDIVFSIEKFTYYLLSPEFIEKYYPIAKAYLEEKYFPISPDTEEENKESYMDDMAGAIGKKIRQYQKGNKQPLISLLEKIG